MLLTDQRIRNLEKATNVRSERAVLKQAVKDGTERVSSLLCAPTLPAHLVGMEVGKLLTLTKGVSYKMACGLCEELRIPAVKRLGQMTYRQRRAVASHVRGRWEAAKSAGRARPGTHIAAVRARGSHERALAI